MSGRVFPFRSIALWGLVLVTAIACGCEAPPPRSFKVGMDLTNEPFEYLEGDDYVGVGPALANAVAAELGRPLEIVPVEFEFLEPDLLNGRIDAIISSFTITPDRSEKMLFTAPYLHTGLAILARADEDVLSLDALVAKGKRVAVRKQTRGAEVAVGQFEKHLVTEVRDDVAAVRGLLAGTHDAFIYDQMTAWRYATEHPDQLRAAPIAGVDEKWGIAVRKEDPVLRDAINAALRKLRSEGTLDRIAERHLGRLRAMTRAWHLPDLMSTPSPSVDR
jgi:ABC-type amino acid transport substrate-binding protein